MSIEIIAFGNIEIKKNKIWSSKQATLAGSPMTWE